MKFTRSVTTTKINVVETKKGEDGKFSVEKAPSLVIYKKATDKDIKKAIKEAYGERTITVTSTESETALYELPLSTFMQYAIEVEKTTEK